jgi:hypothetical protein
MSNSIFKPKGPTKASRPDAGGAALRTVPVLAVVKDTIDTIRCGRIRVYIADKSGRDPNDSTSWTTVNYMSPFYGTTIAQGAKDNHGTYLQNPSSYGMWNAPPDIGSSVICIFINGDPDYGYWIGCVPEPESLFMVPAIGSAETVIVNENEGNSYGGATKLPVSNINTNNSEINNSCNTSTKYNIMKAFNKIPDHYKYNHLKLKDDAINSLINSFHKSCEWMYQNKEEIIEFLNEKKNYKIIEYKNKKKIANKIYRDKLKLELQIKDKIILTDEQRKINRQIAQKKYREKTKSSVALCQAEILEEEMGLA